MKLSASKHFQKQIKKLHKIEKDKIINALNEFITALERKELPNGLGFKKINHDKYEIRIGLKTRAVMKLEQDTFVLLRIGSHNEIERFLSSYRNK